jgi:cob(I)alamin adenosyltransferase
VKIYTKSGDDGSTALIGGRRVQKYHPKIEAYGTVDELMAFVAVISDSVDNQEYKDVLLHIQDRLMTISSLLASDFKDEDGMLPKLFPEDIQKLEDEIDRMETKLVSLNSFILPGGNIASSFCHVARTITRRAERIVIRLADETAVDELTIKYLNRLSDYFFVLSRMILRDLGLHEIVWKPSL